MSAEPKIATVTPIPSAPAPAGIATHILELVAFLVEAHDAKRYGAQQQAIARLVEAGRLLETHLGPVHFEPATRIDQMLDVDRRAGYEIWNEDGRVFVRIADATGHDASLALTAEQAAQLRIDLARVLLGAVKS